MNPRNKNFYVRKIVHGPMLLSVFRKKRPLGPQNGSRSLGPEKLLKIVSCVETEKLKEPMVRVQME